MEERETVSKEASSALSWLSEWQKERGRGSGLAGWEGAGAGTTAANAEAGGGGLEGSGCEMVL